MIERPPSARGPNSMRPCSRPITFSSSISRAIAGAHSPRPSLRAGIAVRLEERLDLVVVERRARGRRPSSCRARRPPSRGLLLDRGARPAAPRPARRRRRRPRAGSRCPRTAPRAAAGRWPRSSAPRRRPGRGTSRRSASCACRAMRRTISSVTTWIERGEVHLALA